MRVRQTGAPETLAFSPRELETLELAATGQTNGEIAEAMGITVHAVKFHLASIYRKLGVTNRTEAAFKYLAAQQHEVSASDARQPVGAGP